MLSLCLGFSLTPATNPIKCELSLNVAYPKARDGVLVLPGTPRSRSCCCCCCWRRFRLSCRRKQNYFQMPCSCFVLSDLIGFSAILDFHSCLSLSPLPPVLCASLLLCINFACKLKNTPSALGERARELLLVMRIEI